MDELMLFTDGSANTSQILDMGLTWLFLKVGFRLILLGCA